MESIDLKKNYRLSESTTLAKINRIQISLLLSDCYSIVRFSVLSGTKNSFSMIRIIDNTKRVLERPIEAK